MKDALRFVFIVSAIALPLFFSRCDNPSNDKIKVEVVSVKQLTENPGPGDMVKFEVEIESDKDVGEYNTDRQKYLYDDVPISLFLVQSQKDSKETPDQTIVDSSTVRIEKGNNTYEIEFKLTENIHRNDSPKFKEGEYYAAVLLDGSKKNERIDHDEDSKKNPGKKMYKYTTLKVQPPDTVHPEREVYMTLSSNEIFWDVDDRDNSATHPADVDGQTADNFRNILENFPSASMYFNAIPEIYYSQNYDRAERSVYCYLVAPDKSSTIIKPYYYANGFGHTYNFNMTIDNSDTVNYKYYTRSKWISQVWRMDENTESGNPWKMMSFCGKSVAVPNVYKYTQTIHRFLFDRMKAGYDYKYKLVFIVSDSTDDYPTDYLNEAIKWGGKGQHPTYRNISVTNLNVHYRKLVKESVNMKNKYGPSWLSLNQSTVMSNVHPEMELPGASGGFDWSSEGDLELEIFDHKFKLMHVKNDANSKPNENSKENCQNKSKGEMSSSWGIDMKWDPDSKEINAGIKYEKSISENEFELFSMNFQAGPVPINIKLLAGYSLGITFHFGITFPTDLPFFPSYAIDFYLNGKAWLTLTGGVGSKYFNVGVYCTLTLANASIGPYLNLTPNKSKTQRRYGTIDVGLKAKLKCLEGDMGFQATIPWIKWCWGVIPCGIEPKIFKYPIFSWNGICVWGEGDGCDPKTIVNYTKSW